VYPRESVMDDVEKSREEYERKKALADAVQDWALNEGQKLMGIPSRYRLRRVRSFAVGQ